jgi:hypothetical protein
VIYHTLAVRSLGELVSFFERHVQHTYMVDPPSHFCNSCGTESARWALLTTAWSGELVVATAWLAVYVVIVAVTINSEPLSRAVALVAQ